MLEFRDAAGGGLSHEELTRVLLSRGAAFYTGAGTFIGSTRGPPKYSCIQCWTQFRRGRAERQRQAVLQKARPKNCQTPTFLAESNPDKRMEPQERAPFG